MTSETLIRVNRGEKDVGYFTAETALACLRSGVLQQNDWAYCEGLLDWIPLGELLGVTNISSPPDTASAPPPVIAVMPPSVFSDARPYKRKIPVVAFIVAAVIACFLGILFLDNLSTPSQQSSSSGITPAPDDSSILQQPVSGTAVSEPAPPASYPTMPESGGGRTLQGGISLAELAAMIGTQLPKGQSVSYYNENIRAGVVSFDPNYQLTSTDEAVIDNISSSLAGE